MRTRARGAAWCDHLTMFAFQLKVMKTEYLTADVNESGSTKISSTQLALRFSRTRDLQQLPTGVGLANSCVSTAWSVWRLMTGLICYRKVPERWKSKI